MHVSVKSNLNADVDFVSALSIILQCVGDTEGLQCAIWLPLPDLWPFGTTKLHLQPVWQDPEAITDRRGHTEWKVWFIKNTWNLIFMVIKHPPVTTVTSYWSDVTLMRF